MDLLLYLSELLSAGLPAAQTYTHSL